MQIGLDFHKKLLQEAAIKLGFVVKNEDEYFWVYSDGVTTVRFARTVPENMTVYAQRLCNNKVAMREMVDVNLTTVRKINYEVVKHTQLKEYYAGKPLPFERCVLKPLEGARGTDVYVDIDDVNAKILYNFEKYDEIIIEEYISGIDIRCLVSISPYRATTFVAQRQPAFIVGDGVSRLFTLIEFEQHRRAKDPYYADKLIKIDSSFNLDGDSVPSANEVVYLNKTTNMSTGSTAIKPDVSASVFDVLLQSSTKILSLLGNGYLLGPGYISVDYIVSGEDVYFLEANAVPGFALHNLPALGDQPTNAVENILITDTMDRQRALNRALASDYKSLYP